MKRLLTLAIALAAVTIIAQEPAPVAAGVDSAAAWDAPTENTDGTPATDLIGYDFALFPADVEPDSGFAPISMVRTDKTQLPMLALGSIDSGEYYIAVRAVDSSGNKSKFARLKIKMDQGVPLPPTGIKITFTIDGE